MESCLIFPSRSHLWLFSVLLTSSPWTHVRKQCDLKRKKHNHIVNNKSNHSANETLATLFKAQPSLC